VAAKQTLWIVWAPQKPLLPEGVPPQGELRETTMMTAVLSVRVQLLRRRQIARLCLRPNPGEGRAAESWRSSPSPRTSY